MPRYYFHVEDGQKMFDHGGEDLPDIAAARAEALQVSSDLLKGGPSINLWHGTPWRLWVTDKPEGAGKIFFTLRFSAEGEPA